MNTLKASSIFAMPADIGNLMLKQEVVDAAKTGNSTLLPSIG